MLLDRDDRSRVIAETGAPRCSSRKRPRGGLTQVKASRQPKSMLEVRGCAEATMPGRDSHHRQAGGRAFSWVLGGYLWVGAFFLLFAHQTGWLGLLSYALLAMCPLMYLLLHRKAAARSSELPGTARAGAGRAVGRSP